MKFRSMIAALLACAFAGCASAPPQSTEDKKPYLEDKAHKVDERYVIGPQPDMGDLQALKEAGFTKVINFRTPEEMEKVDFNEPDELAALGIDYHNIPVGGDDYGYTPQQAVALSSALEGADKVLLHCAGGWRASVITIAYLINEEGMSLDEAMTHAQGWWPLQLEEVLDRKLTIDYAP